MTLPTNCVECPLIFQLATPIRSVCELMICFIQKYLGSIAWDVELDLFCNLPNYANLLVQSFLFVIMEILGLLLGYNENWEYD